MDKIIERSLLFDFYGDLLTEHQQKVYSEAVFNDLSLSELSDDLGISRQGVADLIKRCDRQLEEYETRLKLIERFQKIKAEIKTIKDTEGIDADIKSGIDKALDRILEEL